MKEERQKREQKGRDAEDQVAAFLEAEGYAGVARRLRTPAGEIDLAAYREPMLAFVEVKARKSVGQGVYSLSERQAARIAGAAEFFLAEHLEYAEAFVRLDLVVVVPGMEPVHFPNAWQVDG